MNYNNPYIKVEWDDVAENLTQERIKRVKAYFQDKYNSTNVKIITRVPSNLSTAKLKSLDASDEILDHQYQKKLMKDYIKETNITIEWDLVNRLDDKVNAEIDKLNPNRVRYNKWFLKKVEFSNFLSYGEDNIIDFTDLDGITVIESTPRNFGGKSIATVDLLLFLFFNSTTKTKTNLDIFNIYSNLDEVRVKGYVNVDGDDYIIARTVIRKKSKTGEYSAKSELEFFKIAPDGTIINFSGEQRRETEAIIASAIGTQEDFLSTILTTGNNLEELIDSKPTARGQILTRFLGLESLKQKEDVCKEMYNEWSKKLTSNTYNVVQLELDNAEYTNSIAVSEEEIISLQKKLKEQEELLRLEELKRDGLLSSRNNDIDQELIRTNPDTLKKEIDELKRQKTATVKLAGDVLVTEPSKYYVEADHDALKKKISDLTISIRLAADAIIRNQKLIKQFEEGSICPTCHRPLEGIDHSDEIKKIKDDNDERTAIGRTNQKYLDKLNAQEQEFITLKRVYDEYERNKLRKAKYELEADQKQLEIDTKQGKLDRYESNRQKLEHNQRIDGEIAVINTHIATIKSDIKITANSIDRNTLNITLMNDKIKVNLELIKKIKGEEAYVVVFKTYQLIYGKNGISKVIMKNMIPLLNQELHRLLSDSCYFTLELNINEKNELEFLMIDNETRIVKPLTTGSGYEKTIASLAIRSVLTKVSSLPKPNIVVMDEVFGKIADDNLEMVGEFFKKIKNYFEHIFVISHNPLIRNWSDNIIMVKKVENISSIDYITTKIS